RDGYVLGDGIASAGNSGKVDGVCCEIQCGRQILLRRTAKEQTTYYRVRSAEDRDTHRNVSSQVPHEVLTCCERAQRLRIEHYARCAVENVHSLGAAGIVVVHCIQRELVRSAVGETDIEAEKARSIPGSGKPACTGGLLERPSIGCRSGPGVVRGPIHGY